MQGSRDNLCQGGSAPVGDAGQSPLDAAWDAIRAGLRRDLGARTFDGWLKPAELGALDADSGELEIVMPSQFMADWVQLAFRRPAGAGVEDGPAAGAIGARHRRAPTGRKPAPLLVLEEIPAAAGAAQGARSAGAQFRPALPLRDLRRRQGQ